MICPDCSALLPHDLAHVQEHMAICTGSTVELFLGRYMSLCESITTMALAGNVSMSECGCGKADDAECPAWWLCPR